TMPSRIIRVVSGQWSVGQWSVARRSIAPERLTTDHWLAECPQHSFRLMPRLFVLSFRYRVGDDAAADRELNPAAADGKGADQDVRIHAAVEADVAETAAIWAARRRLQLGDDFHRPNLRCPGHRAAWKRRTQEIDRAESFAQAAADFRDQVMH